MKFYAVKCDSENVIFESWDEAKDFMVGKKNIKQKSFKTYEEAKLFLADEEKVLNYDIPTVYIDGSYDINTGCYSFGGVLIIDNINYQFNKKFEADEYSSSRNVAGEIKGAAYIINHCRPVRLSAVRSYFRACRSIIPQNRALRLRLWQCRLSARGCTPALWP